ncbi:MAG TPA: DUF2922 domain-containing protein [Clostridiales bacterium]|nr:DUF2922 domain-containing protein [Clostridiales bacterium]
MANVLEMVFKTGEGKNYRLTLNDPKEGLTGAEVRAAMDLIVSNDTFNIEGGLVDPVSAAIISTDKVEIDIG